MNIPITKPLIDDKELKAVKSPLESGWLVQGPQVKQFEDMVAQYCSVPYAVATSSCTSALHLSLLAAGIGSGDKVLVPSFTYVATANAVEHAGAEPVFVDIEPETFNISSEDLGNLLDQCESSGGQMPSAVMAVHLFGLCADMEPVEKLAKKNGILIIEDAACALGSEIQGKSAGTFGFAGCFSFHPRKVITTGEGGMVVTGDEQTAAAVRMLRDHGAEISNHARHESGLRELP